MPVFILLPQLRTLALLTLLLILVNANVGKADDNLGLSVNSMPLSIFTSAIEEGMSISIEVDESIADFTIDGQFNGSIEVLLDDLHTRYGIDHSGSGGVYKLWRDHDFSSQVQYQFQLSDMDIVTFLTYLSQSAGYQLLADTSIDINLNGGISGTLQEIIGNLSNQYPVLFYVRENTISVVPESSFEKKVVQIADDYYSSESILTELRTQLLPGNFVSHKGNQLIVGGHPEFVRTAELQLRIEMFNSASQTLELLAALIPEVLGEVKNLNLDKPESNIPYRTAVGPVLASIEKSDVFASIILDDEFFLVSKLDAEAVVQPIDTTFAEIQKQPTDVAALKQHDYSELSPTPKEYPEPALVPNADRVYKLASKEDPDFALAPKENPLPALVSIEDTELMLKQKYDTEFEFTQIEDLELEVASTENSQPALKENHDGEFALTPNEVNEFTLTLHLDDVVALIPKLDAAFVLSPKLDAGFVIAPERNTHFALPTNHEAKFALVSILDIGLLLPTELDADFTLPAKRIAEFALSPESEAEVAISVILGSEITVISEPVIVASVKPDTEISTISEQNAEVEAMVKRNAVVGVSTEPEGIVAPIATRDAEIEVTPELNDEVMSAVKSDIKVTGSLEQDDADSSVTPE